MQEYPWIIQEFHALHLSPSASAMHVFGLPYGSLLLFLALSSLCMSKPGTKSFRRVITLSTAGLVMAALPALMG